MSSGTDATILLGQGGDGEPTSDLPNIPDVTLERELGRGGMGAVWLGRQELLDRPVAVKMMLVAGDKDFLDRFKREARILANLAHPHIVSCYHAGICDHGHPYMVMEYVDGPDLKVYIRDHGPLSDAACLRLADEIATGLGHACDQGIIHRDVKPENILLAPCADSGDDLPYRAKVADLGLARPAILNEDSSQALTAAGAILGTPATMSPEQFDDPDNVDHRSDIYGLGCILYHARCGQPAFEGKSIATLVASKVSGQVPDPRLHCDSMEPRLAALIQRCLARSRDDRPATWAELRAMLHSGPPSSGGAKGLLLGAVAVALVIAVIVGTTLTDDDGSQAAPSDNGSISVAVPAAPEPAAPATPTTGLQRPLPLFGDVYEQRFADWHTSGALWDSDMESSDVAVNAFAGAISRPLPTLPVAIEGELTIGAGCNGFFVGVDCADGRHFGLWLNELGVISAYLGRWESDFGPPTANVGGWNAAPTDRFRLEIHADRIVGRIGDGEAAELTLTAEPTSLRLYKQRDEERVIVRVNKLRALPIE